MKKLLLRIYKVITTMRLPDLKLITLLVISVCLSANGQVVTTLAGSTTPGSINGTGASARFNHPYSLASDGSGNLYVADYYNNEIRKIVISSGAVSTLAGSTLAGSSNGTGTAASFNGPAGVACDGSGNLFVADAQNNKIRKIVISTGVVTTLAGSGIQGAADGTGFAASFHNPFGLACDANGNLFVADNLNSNIRKIVISTGVVTTLAGSGSGGSANGTGATASFLEPTGLACDASGNLYVADYSNYEIRKIVISTGVVTTLAGSTVQGAANGTGAAASFNYPSGVACDLNGNLYVADGVNNEIRKIVIATGAVTTLCGSTTSGSANGTGAAAGFYIPFGIAYDVSGNLFVADEDNNEIRKISGIVGVEEMKETREHINVYPNPANDQFVIETAGDETVMNVFDLNGRLVLNQALSSKATVDVTELNEGVYTLMIKTADHVINKKLVIVR